MKRILITSGGTKVPIDPVRYLTNMSKGTFGSKLAKEALNLGHNVTFFCQKNSESPFYFKKDLYSERFEEKEFIEFGNWVNNVSYRYKQINYSTFQEYHDILLDHLANNYYNVIFLAAAVSDYTVIPSTEKIRTKENLTINLEEAAKVISKIRSCIEESTVLVGFKLLVNSSQEELIENARLSIEKNDCDLVVANDLKSLKAGNHEIFIVEKNGNVINHKENVAKELILKSVNHKKNY